jgi:S-adenosylmethionine hydrolase
MKRPLITLLTDFGLKDHYVAAMKGVILGIAPEAQLVDITHEIGAYAIAEAAYTLEQAVSCFPEGTVHLVVVDPGVGSSRRAIVAEVGEQTFVAPDNGVLSRVLRGGGVVREITAAHWFRQPVSNTFHGRDIFAPVAARLCSGGLGDAREEVGPVIEDPVRLEEAEPREVAPGEWTGVVLKVDGYGNLITNFEAEHFRKITSGGFELRVGTGVIRRTVTRFDEGFSNEPCTVSGSAELIEVIVNKGNAALILGASAGTKLRVKLTV